MLQTAVEAARAAGQILVERLSGPRDITVKGIRDIVTDADLAAERAIVECLHARFPDHGILTEEAGLDNARHSEYLWIIDPLDGTTNYSRRHPCFSTAIGLSHRGQMVLGVVYDPLNERLFQAERGSGATLNGQPLRVSDTGSLNATIAALDWAHKQEERERIVRILTGVAPRVGTLRALGSAALAVCYVAAGWVDAYFHLTISAWDVAAAGLIVEEAGGTLTDLDGHPWELSTTRLLVSNGRVHEGLLALINQSEQRGMSNEE